MGNNPGYRYAERARNRYQADIRSTCRLSAFLIRHSTRNTFHRKYTSFI